MHVMTHWKRDTLHPHRELVTNGRVKGLLTLLSYFHYWGFQKNMWWLCDSCASLFFQDISISFFLDHLFVSIISFLQESRCALYFF